jgi:fatty-acyl-CoA synthase
MVVGEKEYSYQEVSDWSRRLAAGLIAVGVKEGDHIAVDMANLPEVVALKFAVARIGAVSVSVNFMLRHEELLYILDQSNSTVLITMDRFKGLDYLEGLDRINQSWESDAGGAELPHLRHIFVLGTEGEPGRGRPLTDLLEAGRDVTDTEVDACTAAVDPASVSDLLYTSGTTGAAKGVLLRHDAVLRVAYASVYTRAIPDAQRMLFALPIYHVFGYIECLIASIFVGGTIYPQASFDAKKLLHDVEENRVDEVVCVPAMTTVILDEARAGSYDLSSLRSIFSSGAAHPRELWNAMFDVLGVDKIFTAYGQTETTASTMCTHPGDALDRLTGTVGAFKPAGAAGDPALGGTLAVYKTIHPETGEDLPPGTAGELVVTGPIVTTGYYNKPDETAATFTEDGWLRTGDLGFVDDQGYLNLTGRKKESYRCGGELVLPSEVESVLTDHPGVLAAHVIGVPHPRMGEVGCAWIVPSTDTPEPGELLAYCEQRLARFKVPATVLFIEQEDVPTTATGRVKKFVLVDRAVAALEPSGSEHRAAAS